MPEISAPIFGVRGLISIGFNLIDYIGRGREIRTHDLCVSKVACNHSYVNRALTRLSLTHKYMIHTHIFT